MTSMLPPELWLRVFEQLQDFQRYGDPYLKTTQLCLISQVCKSWRNLVEPLLYRKMTLIYQQPFEFPMCEFLRRNLQRYPRLKAFIQDLELDYSSKSGRQLDSEVLKDLQDMTNLTELSLLNWDDRRHRIEPEPSAEILTLVAEMNVEHLRVTDVWVGLMTK